MLEFVDAAFDQVACAIRRAIVSALAAAGRDHGFDATISKKVDEPVGIVSAIGKDMAATLVDDELSGTSNVVALPRCEQQPDRPA